MAPYAGADATGSHVIACWTFDAAAPTNDAGPNGLHLRLQGATAATDGRFGGALEPLGGAQELERKHGAVAPDHPALSVGRVHDRGMIRPAAAFTNAGEAFLVDKKYAGHTDYQFTLGAADKAGLTRVACALGFGKESDGFVSDPAVLAPGEWVHVAFTYDGEGRGRFP